MSFCRKQTMSIPSQASRFEHDKVHLTVDSHTGPVPVMSTAFCEDIRYWSDGTETSIGEDRIYLQLPHAPMFIPVEARDGLEMGTLYLPEEWIQELGITYIPTELEFSVVRPSMSNQLDRFY